MANEIGSVASHHIMVLSPCLSSSSSSSSVSINENFPNEQFLAVTSEPWLADIVNFLVTNLLPAELSKQDKRKFLSEVKNFLWDDPHLFKTCHDQIIRRCVPDDEQRSVLSFCHKQACGRRNGGRRTAEKVLQSGFYWPTLFKDAFDYCKTCPQCQFWETISKENEMFLQPNLVVEMFDVWEIYFMGPFPCSFGKAYIVLAVEYVSKWVEAFPTRTKDNKVVDRFLRDHIFSRFGHPRAILCDNGTHFCNRSFQTVMRNYGITHRLSTPFHLPTSGQADVSNRQIKQIIEKTVSRNPNDWSKKLIDALWAYRIAYKTNLEMSPYRLIFGKACHLPVEIEHQAMQAIVDLNMDLSDADSFRKLQLSELEEQRREAYDNAVIVKNRTKVFHDKHFLRKTFTPGQQVLLFDTRLHFYSGILRSRWNGPFIVTSVYTHGAIEIENPKDGVVFKVNGNHLKPFLSADHSEVLLTLQEPSYHG